MQVSHHVVADLTDGPVAVPKGCEAASTSVLAALHWERLPMQAHLCSVTRLCSSLLANA